MTDLTPSPKLEYDRPAAEWTEALPIGNGRLGAMVFGGITRERLQLNEDTLWSGGPSDGNNPEALQALPRVRELVFEERYEEADALCQRMQGPFSQSYQPLGDLWLDSDWADTPTEYRRELDLDSAVATVSFRVGETHYTRQAFASFPAQVIAMRLAAHGPGRIALTARLDSPIEHRISEDGSGDLVMLGRCPSHVDPSYYPTPNPILYEEGKGMQFEARLRASVIDGALIIEEGQLRVAGAREVLLLFASRTTFMGYDRPPSERAELTPRVLADLGTAVSRSADQLLAEHQADHRHLFRRVTLDLGDTGTSHETTDQRIRDYVGNDPKLVALLFQYGRYLLIASSRPGTQPANLQGIWNHHVRPVWSSNWTLNINAEMNYWPAETCNLSELHEPLFDLVRELACKGEQTARINYGCRGWTAHHNTDIWRQSAPAGDFGHGNPQWAMWPMAGAWLCQHLWEHYAFTLDIGFLRTKAWPLMVGASRFIMDWLIEDGSGRLITAPSTSPENVFAIAPSAAKSAVSMATTMDMALIWDLLSNCLQAGSIVDAEPSLLSEMEEAQRHLLQPAVGRHGQLQEWYKDWDDPDDHHRHVSHLFGIHPGRQITHQGSPALMAAAERSLELRGDGGTGWSMGWKVNLWARLHDGDHALTVLSNMLNLVDDHDVGFRRGGVYANLFDAHPPFQIDGNLGVTAGIAEMLLQSHTGEIELLPALPSAWARGNVRGLCARGGFTVEIAWDEGRLVSATILSGHGSPCRIRYGERTASISTSPGQSYRLDSELAIRPLP